MNTDKSLRLGTLEGVLRTASEADWTPIRFTASTAPKPDLITWASVGTGPFNMPFFDDEIDGRLSDSEWFVSRADMVKQYAMNHPGVPLRGIVWHMSRCGSTLARNLLAETDVSVAIGEPSVVNSILGKALQEDGHKMISELLCPVITAIFRPNIDTLQRGYLKCSSWNILLSRSVQEALPDIPAIFVHRDPLLVLASLESQPAGFMDDPTPYYGHFGIRPHPDRRTQTANILAGFLQAALDAETRGYCRFVAYDDILNRMLNGDLPEYFGYKVNPSTRERMIRCALRSSKNLANTFTPDEHAKRALAASTPGLEALSQKHLGELYQEVRCRSRW
ncbi:MAG: hypothetical protein AAGI44_13305 [Pseudomonadota bacterium]